MTDPDDRTKNAAECPKCNGLGGGYVRTGPDDQWDSETCDWCWGSGYIPAALVAELATARTVTHRFIDGWAYNSTDLGPEDGGNTWFRGRTYEGYEADEEEAMSEAERAWLAGSTEPEVSP